MSGHQAIIEALPRLSRHVADHEWDGLADALADPVRPDDTALQGGEPIELPPDEVAVTPVCQTRDPGIMERAAGRSGA